MESARCFANGIDGSRGGEEEEEEIPILPSSHALYAYAMEWKWPIRRIIVYRKNMNKLSNFRRFVTFRREEGGRWRRFQWDENDTAGTPSDISFAAYGEIHAFATRVGKEERFSLWIHKASLDNGRLVSFKQVWLWLISLDDSLVFDTYVIA